MDELFKQDDFRQQYELARQQGDSRFGAECKHRHVKSERCLKCLRKVVDTPVRKETQV
jgi:hypothetical protein